MNPTGFLLLSVCFFASVYHITYGLRCLDNFDETDYTIGENCGACFRDTHFETPPHMCTKGQSCAAAGIKIPCTNKGRNIKCCCETDLCNCLDIPTCYKLAGQTPPPTSPTSQPVPPTEGKGVLPPADPQNTTKGNGIPKSNRVMATALTGIALYLGILF